MKAEFHAVDWKYNCAMETSVFKTDPSLDDNWMIMFLDCYPVHTRDNSRFGVCDSYPFIILCFVSANCEWWTFVHAFIDQTWRHWQGPSQLMLGSTKASSIIWSKHKWDIWLKAIRNRLLRVWIPNRWSWHCHCRMLQLLALLKFMTLWLDQKVERWLERYCTILTTCSWIVMCNSCEHYPYQFILCCYVWPWHILVQFTIGSVFFDIPRYLNSIVLVITISHVDPLHAHPLWQLCNFYARKTQHCMLLNSFQFTLVPDSEWQYILFGQCKTALCK